MVRGPHFLVGPDGRPIPKAGLRQGAARRKARQALDQIGEAVKEELRRRGGAGFWGNVTWEGEKRRFSQLSPLEIYRFLVWRCVFCGNPIPRKKAWGHDTCRKECMFGMLDVLMRRRGHKV